MGVVIWFSYAHSKKQQSAIRLKPTLFASYPRYIKILQSIFSLPSRYLIQGYKVINVERSKAKAQKPSYFSPIINSKSNNLSSL